MLDDLIDIAFLSYRTGLIGCGEYIERCEVAYWLADESGTVRDPRADVEGVGEEVKDHPERLPEEVRDADVSGCQGGAQAGGAKTRFNPTDKMQIVINAWYFTGSDPDFYPSVPHGHYQNAMRPWPKLNPYTGRVFVGMHRENSSMRLKQPEMRDMWRNKSFREFCLRHVIWYETNFQHFRFRVPRPHRFPVW